MSRALSIAALLLCTMLLASEALATEDKPPLIDMSAPAAPPDSAEARIALRQHREVSALNRYTFVGNVLQGVGDLVEHWIVMFCPGWHDKCQALLPSYELLGVQWENKLNQAVMRSGVRFAKVDCATEKALCVSLDIDDYPSVVHYRSNQRVASWHGGAPGLVRFVKQELEGPRRRPNQRERRATPVSACAATSPYTAPAKDESAAVGHYHRVLRPVCFGILLIAAASCIWKVSQSAFGDRGDPVKLTTLAGGTTDSEGCSHRSTPKTDDAVPSACVTTCLPKEWSRERSAILL